MVTAADFTTCKSDVISLLQASQTPYASTVDGSNRQFNSDTEIANAILYADSEIATVICNTIGQPYQTTFVQTSSPLASGASLPARIGIILKVQCQTGISTMTFLSSQVSVANNIVGLSVSSGLSTGQKVQLTTSGTLPTGLALATDYYVIANSDTTFSFASTAWNAQNAVPVVMTGQGSGTNTVTAQYMDGTQALSKDEIIAAINYPNIYGSSPNGVTAGHWFIEGDVLYSTSPLSKVLYTDYTLTTVPQCPQPYSNVIVAGAIAHLWKDGGDANQFDYYSKIYTGMMQMVAGGAMVVPAITSYLAKVQ